MRFFSAPTAVLKRTSTVLLALLCTTALYAQFSVSENDAASLRWNSLTDSGYSVIYPTGCDSLANVFLNAIEKYRLPVSYSIGMVPGARLKRPMPVLLHTQNAASNGLVVWAPHRMELNTLPEWETPDGKPWAEMLAIHEGRHTAQMQMGYKNVFGALYYVFGEIMPGAAAGYPGRLFLEGDAVVAETALTNVGRGRSPLFFNYYNYSLDNGDTRNWMRWRLGSYYWYTPDEYAFGYTVLSGIRVAYDAPDFMARYMDYISRRPYNPYPFRFNLRKVSGKPFRESFPEIMQVHYQAWAADTASRKPYMPYRQISPKCRRQLDYVNPNVSPDGNYVWVKRDIYHNTAAVELDGNGREKKLFRVSNSICKMNYVASDSSLVWSEMRYDPRWKQKNRMIVRKYSFSSDRKSRVTRNGQFIYPVEFSGDTLAVIRYNETGGSAIAFINKDNGTIYREWKVPGELCPINITGVGGYVYATAVCGNGCGIWRSRGGAWENVLTPIPVRMSSLEHEGDILTFESDHNGQWEFYKYDPDAKVLTQISSTKYGGGDYSWCPDGDLTFSMFSGRGAAVMLADSNDLVNREVKWEDYYHYPIAEKLSQQEAEMAYGARFWSQGNSGTADTLRTVRPYVKGAHAIRLHSWAPAYVDYNNISELSFENVQRTASLGAMAFFQNTMSTLTGYAGYKAAPDSRGEWFHSGHLNLTYKGLYPVFEGEVHVNDRHKYEYYHKDNVKDSLYRRVTGKPGVNVSLKTYVPLSWTTGTVNYGVTPFASVLYINDTYDGNPIFLPNAGVRAYLMTPTPSAAVYPTLGIGAELDWSDPYAYAFVYGYLPGIAAGQGIKLTCVYQDLVRNSPVAGSYANLMPRGFAAGLFTRGLKLTADYAIPFSMGDWRIGDCFYCTRGILTPHFDYSAIMLDGNRFDGNLWSGGASLELEFGSFFWMRTPVRIGVTYSYNSGSLFEKMADAADAASSLKRHYVGFLFNIDLPN